MIINPYIKGEYDKNIRALVSRGIIYIQYFIPLQLRPDTVPCAAKDISSDYVPMGLVGLNEIKKRMRSINADSGENG